MYSMIEYNIMCYNNTVINKAEYGIGRIIKAYFCIGYRLNK